MAQRLRLDIDQETYDRLIEIAIEEKRPIRWQAEVILAKAVADYFVPTLRSEPLDVPLAGIENKG
jgi:hypothetical protein